MLIKVTLMILAVLPVRFGHSFVILITRSYPPSPMLPDETDGCHDPHGGSGATSVQTSPASSPAKPATTRESTRPAQARRRWLFHRRLARRSDMRALLTCCVNNVLRYYRWVLRSVKDRDTEAIWDRQRSRRLDGPTQHIAWRKLAILDAAETLTDLRIPPGNRLEKLTGDRAGQHSIRINRQWRICFSWSDAGPENIEIVDYH
jgi:toxin HigB-1